jgi:hypothetical protein
MSEEDGTKFEAELAWCLEQLQASLESGKLNQKQGKHDGNVNILNATWFGSLGLAKLKEN